MKIIKERKKWMLQLFRRLIKHFHLLRHSSIISLGVGGGCLSHHSIFFFTRKPFFLEVKGGKNILK